MNAVEYYDGKRPRRRSLEDGRGVRNTHNFIKAVLISRCVPCRSHVLDLGCGQGGDVLKFKRTRPKSYRGIDVSHTAIETISKRLADAQMGCRTTLECVDFGAHDWSTRRRVDAVSCQFAIQYAFETPERAEHTVSRVSRVLRQGGMFFGTVPSHTSPTYTQVAVQLPGDARTCLEYSVQHQDVERLCASHGLEERLWSPFDTFCEEWKQRRPDLFAAMRASSPDPDNVVFVYEKV